jgi:predicted ribosomally synthesized peptide with nif11-like leader
MSIKNATTFFNHCRTDPELRKNLYRCESRQELLCRAEQEGFKFTNREATTALQNMTMNALDEDAAQEVHELKIWYELQTEGEDPLAVCTACSLRYSCSNYRQEEAAEESSALTTSSRHSK